MLYRFLWQWLWTDKCLEFSLVINSVFPGREKRGDTFTNLWAAFRQMGDGRELFLYLLFNCFLLKIILNAHVAYLGGRLCFSSVNNADIFPKPHVVYNLVRQTLKQVLSQLEVSLLHEYVWNLIHCELFQAVSLVLCQFVWSAIYSAIC